MHPPKILHLPLSSPRHRWKGSRQRNAGIFLEESRVSGYSLLICRQSYWMQEPFPGRQIRYCITLALSASLSFLLIPRKFSAGRTSGRAIFVGLGQRLTLCFLTQKRRSGRASPSSRRGELGVRAWAPGRICRRSAEPPEEPPPPPPPRCPAALMGCGGGSLSGGPLGRVPAEGNLLSGTGGRPPAGRERGGGAGGRAGGGGGRRRWDGAMLGGRAQGQEKRRAGARRLGWERFVYCSGSSCARGFGNDRAIPTHPGFPVALREQWSSRRVGDADPLGVSAKRWVKATRLPFSGRESV